MYLSFCIFTFFKGKCRFDLEKKKSAQNEKFHYWFYPFVCFVIFFFNKSKKSSVLSVS